MMRVSGTALLLFAIVCNAACGQRFADPSRMGRELLKNIVSASSTVTSEGGTSEAISIASTKIIKQATNAIATSISEAVGEIEDGGEFEAQADATATAVAKAFLQIELQASVDASVAGRGSACGTALGKGQSSVDIVAKAVATSLAKASNDLTEAVANSTAEAVKMATVEVEGKVRAEACSFGGVATAFQRLVARGTVKAIAKAFTEVYAIVAGEDGDAVSTSTVKSTTKEDAKVISTTDANVDGIGDASASGSGTVTICDTAVIRCCNPANFAGGPFCSCGDGCLATKAQGVDNSIQLFTLDGTPVCEC